MDKYTMLMVFTRKSGGYDFCAMLVFLWNSAGVFFGCENVTLENEWSDFEGSGIKNVVPSYEINSSCSKHFLKQGGAENRCICDLPFRRNGSSQQRSWKIRLIEKILHHLGCPKRSWSWVAQNFFSVDTLTPCFFQGRTLLGVLLV